jgi:hypothetical protein
LWATLLGLIAILAAIATVISGIIGFAKVAEAIGGVVATVVGWFGGTVSVAGALALAGIIAVAVATATLIIVWAWQSYNAICGSPPFGKFACVTGVVNAVTAGFSQWYSQVVGFAGNQPQLDVVVKSDYWPIVTMNNPPFVWCAGCQNCSAAVAGPAASAGANPGCSAELTCFYHNNQVCGAALGGAVGATVGAVIGAALGIVGAVAAMAALGCTLGGPFALICWIILLIVLIIVIIVVVVVALIGAAIGTQAGKAAAGGSATPTSASGTPLVAGAYVSVLGNLVQSGTAMGANALWFAGWIPNANGTSVDDATAANHNGTTVFGRSTGVAPFCFTDPDANIPASMDICFIP